MLLRRLKENAAKGDSFSGEVADELEKLAGKAEFWEEQHTAHCGCPAKQPDQPAGVE
jgi:hypothetical protein